MIIVFKSIVKLKNKISLFFYCQVLEKVLSELERVCIAEQDFCFKFFHLFNKKEEGEEKVCLATMRVRPQE